MKDFDFNDLFVLDLANNHQGSVEHALKIIDACGQRARAHDIRAAMKFQFRQLDTFVHPAHKSDSDNKHIPRFLATRLTRQDWDTLLAAVKDAGMLAMCTPFDEESVEVILDMGFDIMKVASCSAKDWPLLEAVAGAAMPVVASTGGLEISDVDNLVSFFDHRAVPLALMHCVSIYPTPDEDMNLNRIDILRRRYPKITIGWSTHEDPDEQTAVAIAVAKGAGMFERHVGLVTEDIKLNAYSSTPEQLDRWMTSYRRAVTLCGRGSEHPANPVEAKSLADLQRGIFARRPIKQGETLTRDDVYFSMPLGDGQLSSEHWTEGLVAEQSITRDGPALDDHIRRPPPSDIQILKSSIHEVKAMLNEASIVLDSEFKIEFSHHQGIANFRKVGALIVDCVNREYCKKLIVVLPGQNHPLHYHKRKEETFQVLSGIFECKIDGHRRTLHPGQTAVVQPGVWHKFWSDTGCIVEEISTTHYNNDSVYNDHHINKLARGERKTVVSHWGRFELEDKTPEKAAE